MITTKSGVVFAILRREMYSQLSLIEDAFVSRGTECIITCGTEGHRDDDPHTHGFALDLRTKHIDDNVAREIFNCLTSSLGARYYILFEDVLGDNEHIHVQYRKDLWHEVLLKERQDNGKVLDA